nr:hypothetical protein [Tanacetum cinerariifolium]
MVRHNRQAPQTMEELCQPSINGQGGPIASIPIQAIDFGLRYHMIQQVQNTCQFHGLLGNDANRHIEKFLEITQDMKQNGVSNDAFHLSLFPCSLTHHAITCNTVLNPREDLKAIITWSGVTLAGTSVSSPPPPSMKVDREPETITDQVLTGSTNNVPPLVVQPSPASSSFTPISFLKMLEVTKDTVQSSTKNIQPPVAQTQVSVDEPVVALKPKPTTPYPSRVARQKLHEKDDNLALKFVEIIMNLHFELSFRDAVLHMPKCALMFKSLLNNKEKLFDLATTLVNENCSAVFFKKLPKKLGDPESFLCSSSLPTQMNLELADRSMTRPTGNVEYVFVKVGKFHFPTDFVVVDYVIDPRVPLIIERPFLRTERALIDVYGGELTLRVNDEAITFKVRQTLKYSYNDVESINRIDAIDVAYEDYVQEVLGFSDNSKSGSPTPTSDPIISSSSPSFTPFEGNNDYYNTKGDILYLKKLLNEDPSPNLPPVKTKDLKQVDATMTKPLIDEPSELEFKELSSHLEYAFIEGTDKLPVIISKELKDEEKSALLKIQVAQKKVKKAFENADSSSRVELIPSKIKYANKVVLSFHKEFSMFSSLSRKEIDGLLQDQVFKIKKKSSSKVT